MESAEGSARSVCVCLLLSSACWLQLDLHLCEVRELMSILAAACVPPPKSAFSLLLDALGLAAAQEAAAEGAPVSAAASAASDAHQARLITRALETRSNALFVDRAIPALRVNKGITEVSSSGRRQTKRGAQKGRDAHGLRVCFVFDPSWLVLRA